MVVAFAQLQLLACRGAHVAQPVGPELRVQEPARARLVDEDLAARALTALDQRTAS